MPDGDVPKRPDWKETPDDRVTAMRLDIGEMRGDMRHLTAAVRDYIDRSEASQQDHEIRLRSVETSAVAVARIAEIDRRLGVIETTRIGTIDIRLGEVENALSEIRGSSAMIRMLPTAIAAIVGALTGIIGTVVLLVRGGV